MRQSLSLYATLGLGAIHIACSDDTFQSSPTDAGTTTLESGTGSLVGLAVISPACGAESAGRAAECRTCAEEQCGTNLAECFGDAYATTLNGGICQTFGQCVMACTCGEQACFQACLDLAQSAGPSACTDCLGRLRSCETSSCGDACTGTAESDAGTGASDGAPDRDARGPGAS